MQSLRCLFMLPYGVYCDTLHRLRSVQSLQLPLFLKVVLSLQHFGHFVKGFCRQKKEYHNIITTAAGGSTRPPWSSSRRCFPPRSCSCGRCFPWAGLQSRGSGKGSPARSLSMRAHGCGRGAKCPPGQGAADLQRAVYMGGCLLHRPVRIRLQGSEPGTVCQSFFCIKNAASYKNDAAKTKISPVDIPTGRDPRTKQQPNGLF